MNIGEGLTTIGSYAFSSCYKLKSLTLPSTLKTIGSYAFQSCSKLEDLKLPPSITTIPSYAFKGCSSLKELHIPSSVESIGDYAFTGCGLKDVYSYTLNPISINQNTFTYDGATLHAPQEPQAIFEAYYSNTQWSQFINVVPFDAKYSVWYTGEDEDITINSGETIPNEDEDNAAEGEMRPGSGLTYKDGAYQWLDKLNLKWKGGKYPSLIDNSSVFISDLSFILTITAGKWYFFCFPFDIDLTKCEFNGKYIWRYYDGETRAKNGSGGWTKVTDNKLKAWKGYIFQAQKSGDIALNIAEPEFTGSDKEVSLDSYTSANAQDASWNFVGNPNLSYYDISNLAKTYKSPITVWDATNNTYNAVSPEDDDYQFHPFEAFFVQKPSSSDAITFEADKRQTCNGAEKASSARRRAFAARKVDANRLVINLSISNGEMTDKTRVVFNNENSMDYETGVDANKFLSSASVPQIYTLDSKSIKYSINVRPNDDRNVKLGYTATTAGNYTISAQRLDCQMALKDKTTGTVFDLSEGDYEFQTEAGTFNDRFLLIPSENATDITASETGAFAVQAVEGGLVFSGVNGIVRVYNASGALVTTVESNGEISVPAGIYAVSTQKGSRKVLVK